MEYSPSWESSKWDPEFTLMQSDKFVRSTIKFCNQNANTEHGMNKQRGSGSVDPVNRCAILSTFQQADLRTPSPRLGCLTLVTLWSLPNKSTAGRRYTLLKDPAGKLGMVRNVRYKKWTTYIPSQEIEQRYLSQLLEQHRAVKEVPIILKIESLSYPHISASRCFAHCQTIPEVAKPVIS